VKSDVGLLRRNRALLALGLAPLVVSALLRAVALHTQVDASPPFEAIFLSVICAAVGLISSVYVLFADPGRVSVAGQLAIGEDGVDFAGARIARRRSLRAGFILPREGLSPLLRLERRWPRAPIELVLRDEEQGSALLRALGFDASQGVVELVLGSRVHVEQLSVGVSWLAWFIGVPLTIKAIFVLHPEPAATALLALGALALTAWAVAVSRSTLVRVGMDGVLIRWFWSTRFIPHRELREVQPYASFFGYGVELQLSSGGKLRLPIRERFTRARTHREVDRVGHRIQQALDLFRDQESADEVRLPERGGREIAAWIKALRASGSGAASDHRTAPTPPEALWQIVEDAAVEPLGRATAMIALSAGLDAPGKERLRSLLEVTAEPELRGVLEAAVEEADEEQLSHALSRLTKH
jgi:hypothetical protein